MLMVKTRLDLSPIHGIGLFADQFIPKGTVTWRFMPGLDLVVARDTLLQLSEAARIQFLNYCYVDKFSKNFILCFDDERFINHSDEPNIGQNLVDSEFDGIEVALRDIAKGEEMLVDYSHFDFDSFRKLNNLDIYSYSKKTVPQIHLSSINFILKAFSLKNIKKAAGKSRKKTLAHKKERNK